jgi:beta propeller repeat protein
MKNKMISVSLLLISFVVLSTVVSAAQLSIIGTGHDPAIYFNNVTWADDAGSIHIYDLTAQNNSIIDSSNSSHPAIYGNTIVWHDENSETPRLTIYDIPTGTMSYITQNVDSSSIPKIFGNRIVWSSSGNIYLFDTSSSNQTQIGVGNSPDIYDTKIVYASSTEVPESDYQGIRMYDINTNKSITVCNEGDANTPHIYGNKIIWSDFSTRMGHIKMYDISTMETIDVTNANSFIGKPINSDQGEDTGFGASINGDKVAYVKISNDTFGNSGLYVYNISTGLSSTVTNYPANVYATPSIFNNTIVWGFTDPRNTGTFSDDIVVCNLTDTETTQSLVADFTSNIAPGNLPLSVSFTDTSTGTPISWLWEFGDGANSTEENPVHIYSAAGNYTVNLTVSNENSTDSKIAAINVLNNSTPSTTEPYGEIEWGPCTKYDTGCSNSISMDNAGHCVEVHVGSGRLYYRVGKVNFDTEEIQWGPCTKYGTGCSNSISMDNAGHCIEVHVRSGRLYYTVGKVDFDDKNITWNKCNKK